MTLPKIFMFPCLCRGIWLFLLSLWFFLLFIDEKNFMSSILPSFLPSSSEVTPSILHRYSIVSPSKRWTNDGVTMDKRWTNDGVCVEVKQKSKRVWSLKLHTLLWGHYYLLSLLFCVFPFLSRSYSVNLEIHSVHSHSVAEARLQGYFLESVILMWRRF